MVAVEAQGKTKKKAKASKAAKPNGSSGASKVAPKSGQSGPPLDLPPAKLNEKEKVVTATLLKLDGDSSMSLAELAEKCFPDGDKKANSWVRNSLRRLVRAGYVAKIDRGTYQMSKAGRKLIG